MLECHVLLNETILQTLVSLSQSLHEFCMSLFFFFGTVLAQQGKK